MIFDRYEEFRSQVDSALSDYLKNVGDARLREGMIYALNGGKRLRPCLMLATERALGGTPENRMAFACALECLHTASLIHDDLPPLDNDEIRHGKASNWARYGEAFAVLQGDALLNFAYELIFDKLVVSTDREAEARAAHVIAKAGGANGMIGGQSEDIAMETERKVNAMRVDAMIAAKTSRFFEAAVLAPCEALRAERRTTLALSHYASALGRAFQIADDLVDLGYGVGGAGKTLNKDARAGKITFVSLYGPSKSFDELQRLGRSGDASLDTLSRKNDFSPLKQLLHAVVNSVEIK